MREEIRRRGTGIGGAIGYPSEQLYEEVAYVAYHLHWPHGELMDIDHIERRRWVSEISKINERINRAQENVDQ